jgi:hypothetical protein
MHNESNKMGEERRWFGILTSKEETEPRGGGGGGGGGE